MWSCIFLEICETPTALSYVQKLTRSSIFDHYYFYSNQWVGASYIGLMYGKSTQQVSDTTPYINLPSSKKSRNPF